MQPNHVKGTPKTRKPRPAFCQKLSNGRYSQEYTQEIYQNANHEIRGANVQPKVFLGLVDVARGVTDKVGKTATLYQMIRGFRNFLKDMGMS